MMQEDDMEDDEEILFDQSALLRVDDDGDLDDTQDDQALLLSDHQAPPQVRKSPRRILQTTCLVLAFFGLGLCIAIPGPTLLDLQDKTHTNTEEISRIFTARSLGYLIGSIIGGVLFDRVNQSCLLSLSLFVTAVATAVAPWCKSLVLLASMISFQGVSMGFLDTGGNVLCLDIWGRSSGPYMQGLHFSFGVGAFVAPWIAEPFLSRAGNLTNDTELAFNGSSFITSPHLPGEVMHRRNVRDVHRRDVTKREEPPMATPAPPKPTKPMLADADGGKLKPDFADGKKAGEIIQKIEKDKVLGPATDKPLEDDSLYNENCTSADNDTSACPNVPTVTTAQPTTTTVTTTTTPITTTTTLPPTTTTTSATTTTTTVTIKTTLKVGSDWTGAGISTDPGAVNGSASPGGIKEHIHETYTIVSNNVKEVIKSLSQASTVQFAYLAIAVFILFVSLLCMVVCCSGKITMRAIKYQDLHMEPEFVLNRETTGFRVQILILLFVFYFLYVGMEVTYGNLIMTFSVEYLGWSKARGTMLTSVFWGSFAAGRGMAIPLSKCLSPAIMLIGDLVLTNLSLIGLVMSLDTNHIMLWFCTATLGVSMASIFPSGISWAETYMQLTGKSTAILVVGSALGEMSVPALTGWLFQVKSPMFLMYVMLAGAISCIVVYIIMQNLASNKGERYQRVSTAARSAARYLEEDTDLEMDAIGLDLGGGGHAENGSLNSRKKRVTFNLHHSSKVANGHHASATITPTTNGTVGHPKHSILKAKGNAKSD